MFRKISSHESPHFIASAEMQFSQYALSHSSAFTLIGRAGAPHKAHCPWLVSPNCLFSIKMGKKGGSFEEKKKCGDQVFSAFFKKKKS